MVSSVEIGRAWVNCVLLFVTWGGGGLSSPVSSVEIAAMRGTKMVNDTNTVPTNLTAPWIKRFFKSEFSISVRVRASKRYLEVWLPAKRVGGVLKYEHKFTPELGNLCMRTVYPDSEKLSAQSWGGNVNGHSISMTPKQWRSVFGSIIEASDEVASEVSAGV